MSLSLREDGVNVLFHCLPSSTLSHISVCVRMILYNKHCNAKPPDVKSQIIRPGFATAFISLPNLALQRGFRLKSFILKGRGVGGIYGLLRMTFGLC